MTNRTNKFIKKLRKKLENLFGGKCFFCGSTSLLEFAHYKPTTIDGKGRGRKERYYDIIKNHKCYVLLCRYCHLRLDKSEIWFSVSQTKKLKSLHNKIGEKLWETIRI